MIEACSRLIKRKAIWTNYNAPDVRYDPRLEYGTGNQNEQIFLIYRCLYRKGNNITQEISAMPGQFRYSVDTLPTSWNGSLRQAFPQSCSSGSQRKGRACFRRMGRGRHRTKSIENGKAGVQTFTISPTSACEYTSHGHCGMLCGHEVDNDATLPVLAKQRFPTYRQAPIWSLPPI